MKKIGLIGGLSWISTAEYYKRLNEITQELAGGVSSSRIVLESVNRQDYVSAVIDRQDEDAACQQIAESARALEAAGADFIVMTCNDIHRFVPKIEPMLTIPFLHIASVTASAIKAKGLKSVAILGVRKQFVSALQHRPRLSFWITAIAFLFFILLFRGAQSPEFIYFQF